MIDDPLLARARALHQRSIVIDSHCDTTARLMQTDWHIAERHDTGHVDLPRLREGGIDAVFLAVYASGPLPPGEGTAAARAQIQRIADTIRHHRDALAPARTAADVRQAASDGKIALLVGIEGGYLIDDSLETLREFHRSGATYMTLTHAFHTNWADSSGVHEPLPPRHGGLAPFGREVVSELNRLGMMVDISHVSDETFRDVLETSTAPIIASHSSCRAVSPHRRNLSDGMMKAIAERGGVVQINVYPGFIDPKHPPVDAKAAAAAWASGNLTGATVNNHTTPLAVLIDHFDHALNVIGPEHVGFGSDFDGVPTTPKGLEDCSKLHNLTAALLARGHSEDDLAMMLGENILRVMEACAKVARDQRGTARD